MKQKVLLGMSGGVDSSVSAILLKQQGYEVIGCTMKLWNQNEENNQSVEDAKKVCEELGITHITVDFEEEFNCHVIKNFIEQYKDAKTPNPCIECNKYLKFGCLYQKAQELGCEFIATGHYARIEYSEAYGQYVLRKSQEDKKDQTYFLYTITKEKLPHILFPLQDYTNKEEIRKIAKENGLIVAKKKDSQEICFIPNNDYQDFIKKNGQTNSKSGKIILSTGEELGSHKGLINYTVGQRKGIGISYPKPLYVIALDGNSNTVIVGEEKELYENSLIAKEVNWMVPVFLDKPFKCFAKIRYRSKEAKVTVYKEEDRILVKFEEAQRAITKGQSIVFYDENGIVLGGGKIEGEF